MPITKLPLGGAVRFRGLSGREEEILWNKKKRQSGEAIDDVLANCTEAIGTLEAESEDQEPEFVSAKDDKGKDKPVQVSDILRLKSPDREKLLFAVRMESFGDELDVSLKCGGCEHQADFTVDLNQCVDIPLPEDYDPDHGFEVTLSTNQHVRFDYMDGSKERVVAKQQGDNALTAAMMARLGEVEGVDKGDRKNWLLNLPIRVRNELRNKMAEKDCGVKTMLTADCPNCGDEIAFIVLAQPGFLFPAT